MWRLLLVVAVVSISGTAQQENQPQLVSTPTKLDCTRPGFMKERHLVFIRNKDGVRVGISTRKPIVLLGEPVIVDIWVDNGSDKPVMSGGRCPPYLHFGDVFDHSGNRLIGTDQAKLDAGKNPRETVRVCASTEILVEIPAHTCMAPVDSHQDNLTLDYKLAPGVYYVFPERGIDPALFKQGLMITVREP
jgi:hypothetical protein